MAGLLDQAGYEPTNEDTDADVIVINTCSVREHAEEKLYTRLGELRVMHQETGHRPVVAVAGCVAQQEGASLLRRSNGHMIDAIVGMLLGALGGRLARSLRRRPGVALHSTPDSG